MKRHLTRRRFVRQAAVVPSTLSSATAITSGGSAAPKSPNESLNVAVIGVAGRGGANLKGVDSENPVALCDIDASDLRAASTRFPRAATFRDSRRMPGQVADRIDLVVVSTPDHTHAAAAAAKLNWDGENLNATNCSEADRYLRREYRAGWKL
jgi:hypothetical protein